MGTNYIIVFLADVIAILHAFPELVLFGHARSLYNQLRVPESSCEKPLKQP